MQVQLWMILAAACGAAAGFIALTALLLGVDRQVRRLAKAAEAAHQALQSNLRQTLEASAPAALPAAPAPLKPPTPVLPPAQLAAALDEAAATGGWTAERRLLVMRLSARGKPAEQIAAALRIPEEEIDLFLKVNKLAPA